MTPGKPGSSPARPRLHIRRRATAMPPAAWKGQTVQEQLRCHAGPPFAPAELAGRLDCSAEDAARLLEFWLPDGPPFLRDQALAVFARVLELNPERLRRLFNQDGAVPVAPPPPESPRVPAGKPYAAPHVPTIVWRKRRSIAAPA